MKIEHLHNIAFGKTNPYKFGLIILVKLLTLTMFMGWNVPLSALEYEGKNLDGRRIPAKAYYQRTGATYEVQVQFEGNRATLFFTEGGQITIQLRQSVVRDLDNIQGQGRLGYIRVGNSVSLGLARDQDSWERLNNPGVNDLWQISISPQDLEDF
ncbi:MAG: hypothetical protein AB4058_14420 [Microcystaceae cyanobacterium]